MNRRGWSGISGMRRSQGGFILLTVIAFLLVLIVLAGAAAVSTSRMRDDQSRDDRLLQGQLGAFSTRATVLYLLGTHRLTMGGLTVDDQVRLSPDQQSHSPVAPARSGAPRTSADDNVDALALLPVGTELHEDGTVYSSLDHSLFALQDDRGRLNVNWSPPFLLKRWVEVLKVPVDQQDGLFAKLLDYQDPDDLYRLNGAEAEQYRAAGLPDPPNRPLLTPLELRDVMGWRKALGSVDDPTLLRMVTASRTALVNINTAPREVLELLPGVSARQVDRLIDMRQAQPLESLATIQEILPGVPQDDGLVNLYPGGSGTLAIWPGSTAAGWVLHWTLTPFDDGGRPWRIDYELRLPGRPLDGRTPAREPQTPLLAHSTAPHP